MPDSPKKRFLKTPHAKQAAGFETDPAIVAAMDAAIMQLSWDTGTVKVPEGAAAAHWQLTGAHKLRELFLTIGVPEKPMPKMPSDNLPHQDF